MFLFRSVQTRVLEADSETTGAKNHWIWPEPPKTTGFFFENHWIFLTPLEQDFRFFLARIVYLLSVFGATDYRVLWTEVGFHNLAVGRVQWFHVFS